MGNRSRGGKQKQGRALIGMPVRDNESQNRIQELLESARKDLERKMNHETTTPFRCHDAEACALGQKPCPTPWACGIHSAVAKIAANVKDAWCSPTCCEVNKVENCNQGRACPVRNGTHKPSEALHNIEEPNGKAD